MEKRSHALINRLIPFSCVDGPGNRMGIFFQGCSFNCNYCHNPETIAFASAQAREYDLEELMEEIFLAAPFIRGITCSGGECTRQSDFLTALFNKVHRETPLSCLWIQTAIFPFFPKRICWRAVMHLFWM